MLVFLKCYNNNIYIYYETYIYIIGNFCDYIYII